MSKIIVGSSLRRKGFSYEGGIPKLRWIWGKLCGTGDFYFTLPSGANCSPRAYTKALTVVKFKKVIAKMEEIGKNKAITLHKFF